MVVSKSRAVKVDAPQDFVPVEPTPLQLGRYVPAVGPIPAKWMLVGEAPGADEESHRNPITKLPDPTPFVGWSGQLLDRMLLRAGLPRVNAYVTNVCKHRPPKNKIEEWCTDVKVKAERNGLQHFTNGRWYNDPVKAGLDELYTDIERVKPEVIVAMGNTPLWALTGAWGITSWRGSELWYGDARLIPTLHPAYVLRSMEQKWLMEIDLKKRVMGKMERPEDGREPKWKFYTGRAFEEILNILDWIELDLGMLDTRWPLSVDVETKKGRIDCFGIAWSAREAICIPVIDTQNNEIWEASQWEAIHAKVKRILTSPRVHTIGQNFNYDDQYFVRDPAFNFRVSCAHDSKVAQHVLLPGTDKDLVTLSSIYCDWHAYWKDDLKESAATLDDEKRWKYNCRDCVVTYEVAMKQLPVLKKEGFL